MSPCTVVVDDSIAVADVAVAVAVVVLVSI